MDDFEKVYQDRLKRENIQQMPDRIVRSAPVKKKRGNIDLPFMILTIVLLTVGVIMVLSASFARAYYENDNPLGLFLRQAFFAVSGIVLMMVVSRFRAVTFRKWSMALLAVSIVMLMLVPVIGTYANGARRWINLGFTTFQPSDVAKLAVVLAFSAMICSFKDKMKTFKYGVLPFAVIVVIIVALLLLEPHLSASVIIILEAVILMYAGGTRGKWFIIGAALVAAAGVLVITVFGYAGDRISVWLDPESDPLGDGFQVLQSLYAIGSGGLTGLGIGQSRQKYLYLPEEHNDYIFPIVCEELGFIGALLVLLLFALLISRGFWIALHARDKYSSLVVTGLTGLLAIQVFLNIGVVTNLLPSTGISLPFFSYGGTAIWMQMIEMGIILSISRDIPVTKAGSD